MNTRGRIVSGLAVGVCLGLASGAAGAEPCPERIVELGHKPAQVSPFGTGMTGRAADATAGNARPGVPSTTGTSVEAKPPRAVAQPRRAAGAPDSRVPQAKVEPERAVLLDRKSDPACTASVARARRSMGGSGPGEAAEDAGELAFPEPDTIGRWNRKDRSGQFPPRPTRPRAASPGLDQVEKTWANSQ